MFTKQLLNFFERKSAKNVSNTLISLVDVSSNFKAFFVFNFLIIEATLPVLIFWEVKFLLYFFVCSVITTMLGWPSNLVMMLLNYHYLHHKISIYYQNSFCYYCCQHVNLCFIYNYVLRFLLFIYFVLFRNFSSTRRSDISKIG